MDVQLRPMTEAECAEWMPHAISSYAEDHIRMGSMPADKAHELAAKQFAELLPDGPNTARHDLLVAEDGGERVGIVWLNMPENAGGTVFVYDVEVDEDKRGQGYGRAIMVAAEEHGRQGGAGAIRLHVFGDNVAARRLYESLGYEATNINMAKPL